MTDTALFDIEPVELWFQGVPDKCRDCHKLCKAPVSGGCDRRGHFILCQRCLDVAREKARAA